MRQLIALLLLLSGAHGGAEPLRITTWNLGSSIAPEEDPAADDNQLAIAAILNSLNADVIVLQEIRDRRACERLADLLKPPRYQVAACSAFKDGSGRRLPQVAILSRKPVTTARTEPWKTDGNVTPPGGFAFAQVRHGSGEIGIFSAQFKDNATSGNFERDTQLNILMREIAAAQLVQQAVALGTKLTDPPSAVVVAGSFNTNPDEPQFVSEITLRLLENAGFKNVFHSVPLEDRITWRGDGRYPDATFDYVFASNAGFLAGPRIVSSVLSGHFPVACEAIIRPAAPAPRGLPASHSVAHWQSIGLTLIVVLFLFCWWWVLGRKRFYSPELAGLVEVAGSPNLLAYPDGNKALPSVADSVDDIDEDDLWFPRPDAARSQIQSLEKRAAAAERRARQATDLVRKGLVPQLAYFLKDRLFRRVASQREQLLLTQQAGADRMAELEQRLVKIHSQMQNRFGAYERRIAELEKEVMAKERINRELLEAKAKRTKEALAEARTHEESPQNI
jgi:endonuclease/exonuclease/phosphatase family metal-dependent hydrolase